MPAIEPWEPDAEWKRNQRTADVVRLRREGLTWWEIAKEVDLSSVWCKKLFFDELQRIPQAEIVLMRQEMSDRFDSYRALAYGILKRRHYVISPKGQLIADPDYPDNDFEKRMLRDDDPIIKALHVLIDVDKQEMKLYGLAAPQQIQVESTIVQYEIVGVDPSETLE